MGLFSKKGGGADKRVRIFYMTDVHGSERTYRKFVNAAKFYKVDHLVMGGDIEGKFLVPIVDEGGGHYRVTLQEEHFNLNGDDELTAMKERIETLGFYFVIVNEEEIHAMQEDKSLVDAAFKKEAHARLERWIDLADERLAGTDIKMYVTGGNDDPQELIDTLEEKQSERVINCEGRIVTLGDIFPMANCGYSNPTPWQTPRETDEETLEKYLEESLHDLTDFENAIFNFHVPPYDSTLDECPKLDWTTDPPSPIIVAGVPQSAPAGSHAVRNVIERHQPLLVLSGHIHEARGLVKIKRSTIVNPGSEYGEGILRGCILTLEPGKIVGYQMTSG
ncbi:MAG TPA: metallophosphoesterase [Thermoleophilia bacterium]|nr:metallophosphoesterase [Thermoleophilia bacterium]